MIAPLRLRWLSEALYHTTQIGGDELDADGKENDTEELTQDGDDGATKEAFQFVDITKHQIVYHDIKQ